MIGTLIALVVWLGIALVLAREYRAQVASDRSDAQQLARRVAEREAMRRAVERGRT